MYLLVQILILIVGLRGWYIPCIVFVQVRDAIEMQREKCIMLRSPSPRDRYLLQDISLKHALRLLPEVNPQK